VSDIIDLTVNNWCENIYTLQRHVEEYNAPVDDVSRGDYHALADAIKDLYVIVATRINDDIAARQAS
jgi:hypothetical protein